MAEKEKIPVLVVPHTHWDRAWFWPFERFRVRLVECFAAIQSELRRHPDYRFTLDGQALMLEDYLEVCPEDRAFLQEMARAGRLKVGPMYCLSDLYCTGGEALIRNLLIGCEIGEAIGGLQRTLHMPDTFGITPSLPMIAAGFGLDTFTFMRGVAGQVPGMTHMADAGLDIPPQIPDGTRMFVWSSPDGSQVRTMRLRDGYANAAGLGRPPGDSQIMPSYEEQYAVQSLLEAAERQMDAQGEPLLLLAGVDHQIPQPQLSDAMQAATRAGRFDFRYADLDEMAGVMAQRDTGRWPRYQGEFHGSGSASVLGGTISARIYLKQTNAAVERWLTRAEAAEAFAALAGAPDPAGAVLKTAWKHLLKTHPHDDICGCSVDPVHQDDEYLMRQAGDSADAVRRRMVRRIVQTFGGNAPGDNRFSFLLLNTQPNTRRGRVRLPLDFEGRRAYGDYQPPSYYAVVDEHGQEVPFAEIGRGPSTEHPHLAATLEVDLALEPMTVRRFFLEERSEWPSTPQTEPVLENERLRVQARPDGGFDLQDKETGGRFERLGLFSDQTDRGDLYDFSDAPGEREAPFADEVFTIVTGLGCSGLQRLRLRGALPLPAPSVPGGWVRMPVEIDLSLAPGTNHLDVRLRFQNPAPDHRLRWNLLLPFRPPESRAGLKFNEVIRPAGRAPHGDTAPRIHPEHPADHFVAVADGGSGLALWSEFPVNYELVDEPAPRLAITLLRSVGFLSRGDLITRPGCPGPPTPTPEGQCLGRSFDMHFAVRPYSEGEAGRLFFESAVWRALPVWGQIQGYDPDRIADGFEGPFLEADTDVVLSALKRKQGGDGIVLRFFNPFDAPRDLRLRLQGAPEARLVGLDERPVESQDLQAEGGGVFRLIMPPFSLRTLEVLDATPWKPAP